MRKAVLLFAVMALAQWGVPWWGILQNENVLRNGVALRFRTAPVDPHDPFRGEYVVLRFAMEDEDIPQDGQQPWTDGEWVHVVLGERNGEAYILRVQRTPPEAGVPYMNCKLDVANWHKDRARIDLPFDRFYLQQGKGRPTEELMRQQAGVGPELPAYALVRVLEGCGIIEDLIVGDRSIHDWLKEE